MTVTDVAEQPPVITSNGGGATAALSVPENQGAGREGVRPNWLQWPRPPTCAVTGTATTWARVHPQRPRVRARSPRSTRRAVRSLGGTPFRDGFTVACDSRGVRPASRRPDGASSRGRFSTALSTGGSRDDEAGPGGSRRNSAVCVSSQRRRSSISAPRWRSVMPPTVFEGAIRQRLRKRAALAGPTFGNASRRS